MNQDTDVEKRDPNDKKDIMELESREFRSERAAALRPGIASRDRDVENCNTYIEKIDKELQR